MAVRRASRDPRRPDAATADDADDVAELTDVFLSYSRKDEAIAERLAETLRSEGFSVWFDRAIRAGADWERTLRRVLANAKAVLVVWSANSVASRWVALEARAARRSHRLVPVRIDGCALPDEFAALETALLDGWDGGPHRELQPLLAGLARLAPPSRVDTVRPGYDDAFLGGPVPLPGVWGVADEIRYSHFSVVMNPARRLAWYSAANLAERTTTVPRSDRWMPDPVLSPAFQPLDEHYRGTGLDRGHLSRALAVSWGDERQATIANRQAFFFTNTAPQHPEVNQWWWHLIEEWEDDLVRRHQRVTSFSGPVLAPDDPIHRDVEQVIGRVRVRANFRLPRAFWKVCVVREPAGALRTAAFVVDQERVVGTPRSGGQAEQFRTVVSRLEERTGVDFGDALRDASPL